MWQENRNILMINVIKDVDLYEHVNEYDVTLIGTNIYGQMSNGIQLNVQLNYPYVFNMNLETKYGDEKKLGTLLECAKDGEPTFCLCYIVKGNFRPDLEKDYLKYESLENCLKLVNIRYKGKNVACPLLGCSRFDGNGDKDRVYELFNKCITDVNLTIYDYYDKSRYEQMKEVYDKEQEAKKRSYKEYHDLVAERKKKAEERFKKNGHRRY